MKIGEARQKYSAQIRAYGEAKANLERQREELEKKLMTIGYVYSEETNSFK